MSALCLFSTAVAWFASAKHLPLLHALAIWLRLLPSRISSLRILICSGVTRSTICVLRMQSRANVEKSRYPALRLRSLALLSWLSENLIVLGRLITSYISSMSCPGMGRRFFFLFISLKLLNGYNHCNEEWRGSFEVRKTAWYYQSLNSLPLHYHSGGCRLWASISAAIKRLWPLNIAVGLCQIRLRPFFHQSSFDHSAMSGSSSLKISRRRLLMR